MFAIRSAPHRRYVWRVAAAMGGYLVMLIMANYLIEDAGVTGALAIAAALLPAICVAGVFWALARLLIEEQDEYQRLLLVRQILIACGLTLTVATLWGFLEDFALAPHVPVWYATPLFFVGLGLGALVNKLTLGDSGGC